MEKTSKSSSRKTLWQSLLGTISSEDRIALSKINKFEDFKVWHAGKNLEQNVFALWQAKQDFELPPDAPQAPREEADEVKKEREIRHIRQHYHSAVQELEEEAREDARTLERPSPIRTTPPRISSTRITGRGAVNRINRIPALARGRSRAVTSLVRAATLVLKRGLITAVSFVFGSIPALIILIILLVFILVGGVLSFLFPQGPGSTTIGANFEQSPYPGISYSISASPEEPERAEIGQEISYKINFIYIPGTAQKPLESIALLSDFPDTGVTIVSSTGNNIPSTGAIRWALSNNTPIQQGEGAYIYSFDLVLRGDDNMILTNTLSLEGI